MAVERTTTTHTTSGAPTPVEHNTVRDREVIVDNTSGDRGLGTLIVGALLVLVVAFLGIYMVNALSGSDGEIIPNELNIDITDSNNGGAEAPAEQAPAPEAPAADEPAPADAPAGE